MSRGQGDASAERREPAPGRAGVPAAPDAVVEPDVDRAGLLPADARTPAGAVDAGELLRTNQQLLRYIHESHVKLTRVLEKSDRSEMVVQSSEALNRTFRRLHESQEALAASLTSERRRQPLLVILSILVAGCAVVILLYFMLDVVAGDLRREAQGFAGARADVRGEMEAAGERFERSGERLVEVIDRGLAANQVLSNENVASRLELEGLRQQVAEFNALIEQTRRERDDAIAAAQRRQADNDRLAIEVDRLQSELVDRDLNATGLRELIAANQGRSSEVEGPATPLPIDGAGDRAATPEADQPAASPTAAPPSAAPPFAAPPDAAPVADAPAALTAGAEALNRFLRDVGVLDLRLLRAGEIVDGRLTEPFLEIREAGFPVGCHQADDLTVEVDPVTHEATIVLRDGLSILRGQRTTFAESTHRLPLGDVANESWLDPVLARFIELKASAAAPPSPPVAVAAPATFDAQPVLTLLNRALETDGYEEYEFFLIGGIEVGDALHVTLKEVLLHVYQAGGALRSTTSAKECRISVDEAGRSVGLRFFDGHHVKGGREVPFFQGRGDAVGNWSLDLTRADPQRWKRVVERLSASDR